MTETLWLRALRAVRERGLLPANGSRLTPGELAAEAAQRGEDRLIRLVECWYYPASYGHVRGAISDEEATLLVAAIEAGGASGAMAAPEFTPPVIENPPARRRPIDCDLCGLPLTLR